MSQYITTIPWQANGNIRPSSFVIQDVTTGNAFYLLPASAGTSRLMGITGTYTVVAPGLSGDTYHATAGLPVEVFPAGTMCELTCGTAWALGDLLTADSNGNGITASSTNYVGAIALEAAAAGEKRRVLVMPPGIKAP